MTVFTSVLPFAVYKIKFTQWTPLTAMDRDCLLVQFTGYGRKPKKQVYLTVTPKSNNVHVPLIVKQEDALCN